VILTVCARASGARNSADRIPILEISARVARGSPQARAPASTKFIVFRAARLGYALHHGENGLRPLDVSQAAVLLGGTRDAVRAACERGELSHARDHLNAYRISCSAVAALIAARLGRR